MKRTHGTENKISVAVVSPQYGLVGGAESCAYHFTRQLAAQEDFKVHVFANRWSDQTPEITFHKVPMLQYPRFMRPISFAHFSNAMIDKGTFDLIHSHGRIFKMDVLSMHGIPHSAWVKKVRKKRMSAFDRATAWVEKRGLNGECPVIAPVSNLSKEEMLKQYPIPEGRMKVIHPGVSQKRFSVLDRAACRREIQSRHGLLESDIVILFVGLNYEVKRLDLVLEGMAELVRGSAAHAHAKLLIVGKPPSHRYLSLARSLGVADRCFFAGVTREIEKYYLASDLFIMPSSYDTFGLVVLEAMMAGLPVIISEKVGAKDLIRSGVQGFVLKGDASPSEIAQRFSFLLNKENRLRMGSEARKTALEHRWENKGKIVADLYRAIFAEKQLTVRTFRPAIYSPACT